MYWNFFLIRMLKFLKIYDHKNQMWLVAFEIARQTLITNKHGRDMSTHLVWKEGPHARPVSHHCLLNNEENINLQTLPLNIWTTTFLFPFLFLCIPKLVINHCWKRQFVYIYLLTSLVLKQIPHLNKFFFSWI